MRSSSACLRIGSGSFTSCASIQLRLEPVELARRFVEQVDHDVVVVEHHPVRMMHPLDGQRALSRLAQRLLDSARDRLHLHVGAPGRHQEIIRHRFQMLGFEHDQVVGLFLQRRFGRGDCLLQRRQEI